MSVVGLSIYYRCLANLVMASLCCCERGVPLGTVKVKRALAGESRWASQPGAEWK